MNRASLLWEITHLRSTIGTCLRDDGQGRLGFLFERNSSHTLTNSISSANLNRISSKKAQPWESKVRLLKMKEKSLESSRKICYRMETNHSNVANFSLEAMEARDQWWKTGNPMNSEFCIQWNNSSRMKEDVKIGY